jgi:hypothetical protein
LPDSLADSVFSYFKMERPGTFIKQAMKCVHTYIILSIYPISLSLLVTRFTGWQFKVISLCMLSKHRGVEAWLQSFLIWAQMEIRIAFTLCHYCLPGKIYRYSRNMWLYDLQRRSALYGGDKNLLSLHTKEISATSLWCDNPKTPELRIAM